MKKIPISKKQYRELMKTLSVGIWIREAVMEGKEDFRFLRQMERDFLDYAKDFGLAKEFTQKYQGKITFSDAYDEEVENTIEEYDDKTFWAELVLRLGKRDYYESLTKEDLEEMEGEILLPNEVHKFYEKYEREFEANGFMNLRLNCLRNF